MLTMEESLLIQQEQKKREEVRFMYMVRCWYQSE